MAKNELSVKEEKVQLPSFIETSEDLSVIRGAELMKDEAPLLAFLKVVQGSSKPPFKPKFKDGDVITSPGMELICSMEESFCFVPVFYFKSYEHRNKFGATPFILDKSFDPASPIGLKARSQNPEDRKGPDETRYVENQQYIISIINNPEFDPITPVVISFSGGEWKNGRLFGDLVRKRCKRFKTPNMFAHQFQASVSLHSNPNFTWYGVDVYNPSDMPPTVDDALRYAAYSQMCAAFEKQYKASGIDVDYESGAEDLPQTEKGEETGTVEGKVVNEKF